MKNDFYQLYLTQKSNIKLVNVMNLMLLESQPFVIISLDQQAFIVSVTWVNSHHYVPHVDFPTGELFSLEHQCQPLSILVTLCSWKSAWVKCLL